MLEVLELRAKKSMREVIVEIPKQMLNENEHTIVQCKAKRDGFVSISTKRYETDHKTETMIAEMIKGYVEMSQINLKIAAECLHAEFEAQHKLERLVIGG